MKVGWFVYEHWKKGDRGRCDEGHQAGFSQKRGPRSDSGVSNSFSKKTKKDFWNSYSSLFLFPLFLFKSLINLLSSLRGHFLVSSRRALPNMSGLPPVYIVSAARTPVGSFLG
jgi:hypothetical protein